LAHFLLFGEHLYEQMHPMRRLMMIRNEGAIQVTNVNNELSDEAMDFMAQLLKVQPLDRMTLEQARRHPWITNPNPATKTLQTAFLKHDEAND
jgi:serine/threonine protein kinase